MFAERGNMMHVMDVNGKEETACIDHVKAAHMEAITVSLT